MKNRKIKSFLITIVLGGLIIFLFLSLGLQYYDPPIEYSMEVSLGNSNVGSGVAPDKKSIKKTENIQKKKAVSKPVPKQKSNASEKVVTQKESDLKITPKKKNKKETKTEETKEETKKEVTDITKKTISNLLKKSPNKENTNTAGKGTDKQAGNKGNPYGNSYYEGIGKGGKMNTYGLKGRNFQTGGKVVQRCDEKGIIVVRIVVNQEGKVISATPGVKGSTNLHSCLLKPAKETAFLHRWAPDSNAPQQQIGFVLVHFKLRK